MAYVKGKKYLLKFLKKHSHIKKFKKITLLDIYKEHELFRNNNISGSIGQKINLKFTL